MPVSSGVGTSIGIAEYRNYVDAERAVDYLSDRKFPVQSLTIIGRDLQMVERVLGRLNWFRAGAAGLGTGAWFGLLIGVLFSIFANTAEGMLALTLGGLLWGALFGAVFGLVGYALTGGRRDFTSRSQVVPSRYEVLADADTAERARVELLGLVERPR